MNFPKALKKRTLSEQVAESIRDAILGGELAEGENLPTEPQLCEQFGVSRAVIRDATRILMAQGLVDAKQGSGVYVTPARNAAFGGALLLSLRRVQATAWDVEEFERLLLPEAAALAAVSGTDAELADLQTRLADYLAVHERHARTWRDIPASQVPSAETFVLAEAFRQLFHAIFEATHNQVLLLLADPLTQLHAMRHWEGDEITADRIVETEGKILGAIVDAIRDRDPQRTREAVATIQRLPDEAVDAMKATAVGDVIFIET